MPQKTALLHRIDIDHLKKTFPVVKTIRRAIEIKIEWKMAREIPLIDTLVLLFCTPRETDSASEILLELWELNNDELLLCSIRPIAKVLNAKSLTRSVTIDLHLFLLLISDALLKHIDIPSKKRYQEKDFSNHRRSRKVLHITDFDEKSLILAKARVYPSTTLYCKVEMLPLLMQSSF